jgi:hypothetical protein
VCGILLALPAPAMAAPMSITGPGSASETAGVATYTVNCGDTPNAIPLLPPVPNTGPLTVAVANGPAPATQAADYGTPSETLLACTALTTSFTVDVPITSDALDEANEKFTISASGTLVAEGAVADSVTTTITDDDPVASVDAIALLTEGDSGTSTADLTVTLTSAAFQPTTIGYSTEDFSATGGSDFTATSGQLVIAIGQTTGTISIPIVGDTTPEDTEAFFVNLLTTDNGSLNATKKQAAVGIYDNDTGGRPTVSVAKTATVKEGDRGTGNILFNVTLSSAATERTEVAWKTTQWTATTADFERANGKIIFQAGQRSKSISVDVKGDRRDEPDEAFAVSLLNPVAATLGSKDSIGVIEDDDGPKMSIGKPKLRGEGLVTTVGCPDSADGCKGHLVGKSAKLALGRKNFDLAKGEERKLKLKLSAAAREALSERRRRAKLIATAADTSGDTRITTRKARLKRLH